MFSKQHKQSIFIFFLAVALFFGSNQYFGWNMKPQTAGEGACDFLVIALLFLAFLWKPVSSDVTFNEKNHNVYICNEPPTINKEKKKPTRKK